MPDERILAIDIGAGTMDVVLCDPARPMENAVQLVLPSATALVGRRIERARRAGRPIFLHGNLMGGYHTTNGVWRHLEAGLAVYATERAAGTVHDSIELLRRRGVRIVAEDDRSARPRGGDGTPEVERPAAVPPDAVAIETRDLDLALLARTLGAYDVTLPPTIAVAAQDHGYSPTSSNRLFRFEHWRRHLVPGATLLDHVWRTPPEYMTRLLAIQRDAPGAVVADTGPVAALGALEDERVGEAAERGACIVNVGNQHTLALLVRGEELFGVVEHHTEALTTEKLERLVSRLVAATVTHDEVFGDDGHGALVLDAYRELEPFSFVAVTGPNRAMAGPLGWYPAAPHGAMMLGGCFGLIRAVRERREAPPERGLSKVPDDDE